MLENYAIALFIGIVIGILTEQTSSRRIRKNNPPEKDDD